MISHKPTHGLPLTPEERAFKPTKNWMGGARFHFTSTHGSSASNSSTHKTTSKTKGAAATAKPVYVRPVTTPKWARKYL